MDYVYTVLVLVSLLLYGLLPFFWLVRHMIKIRFGAGNGKLDLTLAATFVLLALVVYVIAAPYTSLKSDLPPYAAMLGWALMIISLATEAWSLFLLGKQTKLGESIDPKLVVEGPYSVVRHPIYICHLAINFGIYLATGAMIPLVVFAEWILLIKPLADIEDEELELRMEEKYLRYQKKVPQLIPNLK